VSRPRCPLGIKARPPADLSEVAAIERISRATSILLRIAQRIASEQTSNADDTADSRDKDAGPPGQTP
jgi:hypothetical protein